MKITIGVVLFSIAYAKITNNPSCDDDQPTFLQKKKIPTFQPSSLPSSQPSSQPFGQPSTQPSTQPSSQPSGKPISRPSSHPSMQPSAQPTLQPTGQVYILIYAQHLFFLMRFNHNHNSHNIYNLIDHLNDNLQPPCLL